ncbi:MAG: clostripain-related cysteine peptidase [Lachnospiraceae bacterium]
MKKRKKIGKYFRYIVAVLISAGVFSAFYMQEADAANKGEKKQTFMLYMIGSDLESTSGAASNDITEIMDACPNISQYNIVIFTGGCNAWELNIAADRNQIWEYTGTSFSCVGETEELKNMCDPETLRGFLDYCYEEYPAESYSLVLWNHGGGPLGGYGMDIQFDNMSMEITDVAQALGDSKICSKGEKLSWLGFDACLMGSLEIASAMSPYAEYMIASEEVEPSLGWDYSFLSQMTEEKITDGKEAGDLIVSEYDSYYSVMEILYPQFISDTTLSCQDLSKVEEVTDALEELVIAAQSDLDSGDYVMLAKKRLSARGFGKVGDQSYDMVDVKNLAEEMQDKYADESQKLISAVDEMVTANYSNVEHAGGISLYYPSNDLNIAAYAYEYYGNLGFSSVYTDYVMNYIYQMALSGERGTGLTKAAGVQLKGKQSIELSYDLTKEQTEDFSAAQFVILETYESFMEQNEDTDFDYQDNGHYIIRYTGKNVSVKDQKLIADYSGENFVIKDKEGDRVEISVKWLEEKNGCDYYEARGVLDSYPQADGETIYIKGALRFYRNQTTGVITVQGFMPDAEQKEDGSVISSRGLIRADKLSDYDRLSIYLSIRKPQYNQDGTMKSPDEWKNETGVISAVVIDDLETGIEISMEKLDNVKGLYGMFIMKDVWNQISCSEMVEIPDIFKKNEKEAVAADTDCMNMAETVFGMNEKPVEKSTVKLDDNGNYVLYDSSEKKHQLILTPFEDVAEARADISCGEMDIHTVSEKEDISFYWRMDERIFEDESIEEIANKKLSEEEDSSFRNTYKITDLKKTELGGKTYYWFAVMYSYKENDDRDNIDYYIFSEVSDGFDLEVQITEKAYKNVNKENEKYFKTRVEEYLGHIKEIR